jgi:hypothetical protein
VFKTYSITFRNDTTVLFRFGSLTIDASGLASVYCRRDKETCTYIFDVISFEAIKLYKTLYGECEVIVNGIKKYDCEEFIEYVKMVSSEEV